MERLMLKPAEAAEAIGLGRTAFYRLVKARLIPSCRVGKSIRIPVAALREWAEERASKEGAEIPAGVPSGQAAGKRD